MSLTVRRCYDLELLKRLDAQIFPSDEPITSEPTDSWWVARLRGLPVGYAGLSETGELVRAGVTPCARGLGVHKRLLQVRLRAAKAWGIDTLNTYTAEDNIQSMRNLARAGFLPTKREDGFLNWSRKQHGSRRNTPHPSTRRSA